MTTGLGAWADDSGGGTPILAADLNARDVALGTVGGYLTLVVPSSPNAKDDEFDGTSSVTWSNTPTTALTVSLNGYIPGRLFIQTSSAANFVGRVQAVPGAYPYTITTRIADAMTNANFQQAGIILGPSSPIGTSAIRFFGIQAATGMIQTTRWSGTFAGTFSNQSTWTTSLGRPPLWFKVTVNSATSIDSYVSVDGATWNTMESAHNPGFTPGVMGLALSANTATNSSASFDFFRVT